jgi:iron complex outermembrane receptor protein
MRYMVLFLSIFSFCARAQKDTLLRKTFEMPEITVEGERSKIFSTGQRIQYVDSASLTNRTSYSLAEQLSYGNAIFIKSYGGNGLATLSLQGSSDVHSAVVWNGFNLQSVMNGSFDLSLFPTFFSDEVGIQSGSASHLWGSGAVGGSVILNNKPEFGKGWKLKSSSELGSFGQFRQQVKLAYGSQKWYANVRAYYAEAQNNYPVSDPQLNASTLPHASTKQKGILAENYFKWKNKHQLALRYWWEEANRENPPYEWSGALSNNFQRANVEYHRRMYLNHLTLRTAWLREDIFFAYPLLSQNTRSIADAFIGEADWQFYPSKRHQFDIGINNTYQQASVNVFDYSQAADILGVNQNKYQQSTPTRNRFSLFGMYRYRSLNEIFTTQISARQEWVANHTIPLVPAIGMELKPIQQLLFKVSGSRTYRIPTFNELYWNPGGNPNILPESGWNMEVSARATQAHKKFSCFYELAFFNRRIDNWIRWVPNGSVWYAQNVAKVWSRGFENKISVIQEIGKSKIQAKASWLYVVSTNEASNLVNDASLGLQLIFTPMYQGNGNLVYTYRGFYFEYNHTYTGYNYISSDHSTWLAPFQIGNFTVSQTIPTKKLKTSLILRVNNVWNADYRTIAAYPMPPRNFQLALQFEFSNPKSNHL